MPEKPKSPVRRCLFGRPDHDVLKMELERELREVEDGIGGSVQKQKWNYDFSKDSPMDGTYEWTVVSEEHYVPEFYRKGYATRTRTFRGLRSSEFHTAVSRSTHLDKLSQASQGNTTNCAPCVPMSSDVRTQIETDSELVHSEGHERSTSGSNTVQSTIPDFMQRRKRRRESSHGLTNRKSPRI